MEDNRTNGREKEREKGGWVVREIVSTSKIHMYSDSPLKTIFNCYINRESGCLCEKSILSVVNV